MLFLSPKPQLSTPRSWIVVLTSGLFFFYIFIQMNLFNSINSELAKEFHLNGQQMGYLYAFFNYGNVLFLLISGIILDRFSIRKILFIAFTTSVLATYAFSIAPGFYTMAAARLIIGFTAAFGFLSSIKLASRWFEPKHMAVAVGSIVTLAMLGGAIAQTPLIIVTQKVGWRTAIQLVTAFGLILITLQLLIVRDEPKGLEKQDDKEHNQLEKMGFWHSMQIIITNKQNWLSGIYISLLNLPLFIFGGIWGVPYLTQAHHFTQVQATEITSMLFIGMMIGSPLAGLISDSIGLRKPTMLIGSATAIIIICLIIFAPTMPLIAEMCLYLSLGLIMGFQVIGYPVIAESNPHSVTATATSLGSILIMAGGFLVPLFGKLLEQSGGSKIVDGITIYSPADFTNANYMLLFGLVISLIAATFVKETYCKQIKLK